MKPSKKEIEEARSLSENAARMLRVYEILWQVEWEAAKTPFEALAQYKKNRFKRKPIIDAANESRQAYDALKEMT
tara:strand:+ start:254 stop:478 length:225 start_codon:yes stop_codon:yes gene_type:complete